MAGINALSSGNAIPLRIVDPKAEDANAVLPVSREERLEKNLDERLSSELNRIRARLRGEEYGAQTAPNPPGSGTRLDITA